MTVDEFLKELDALSYDTSIDEEYPQLREKIRRLYPSIRELYKTLINYNLIVLDESKTNVFNNSREETNFKIKKIPYKKQAKKININTDFDHIDDDIINEAINKVFKRVFKKQ